MSLGGLANGRLEELKRVARAKAARGCEAACRFLAGALKEVRPGAAAQGELDQRQLLGGHDSGDLLGTQNNLPLAGPKAGQG
jgi:hypothetical protein